MDNLGSEKSQKSKLNSLLQQDQQWQSSGNATLAYKSMSRSEMKKKLEMEKKKASTPSAHPAPLTVASQDTSTKSSPDSKMLYACPVNLFVEHSPGQPPSDMGPHGFVITKHAQDMYTFLFYHPQTHAQTLTLQITKEINFQLHPHLFCSFRCPKGLLWSFRVQSEAIQTYIAGQVALCVSFTTPETLVVFDSVPKTNPTTELKNGDVAKVSCNLYLVSKLPSLPVDQTFTGETSPLHILFGEPIDSTDSTGKLKTISVGSQSKKSGILGLSMGLVGACKSVSRIIIIPPTLGLGNIQVGNIPANSSLVCLVTVQKVKPSESKSEVAPERPSAIISQSNVEEDNEEIKESPSKSIDTVSTSVTTTVNHNSQQAESTTGSIDIEGDEKKRNLRQRMARLSQAGHKHAVPILPTTSLHGSATEDDFGSSISGISLSSDGELNEQTNIRLPQNPGLETVIEQTTIIPSAQVSQTSTSFPSQPAPIDVGAPEANHVHQDTQVAPVSEQSPHAMTMSQQQQYPQQVQNMNYQMPASAMQTPAMNSINAYQNNPSLTNSLNPGNRVYSNQYNQFTTTAPYPFGSPSTPSFALHSPSQPSHHNPLYGTTMTQSYNQNFNPLPVPPIFEDVAQKVDQIHTTLNTPLKLGENDKSNAGNLISAITKIVSDRDTLSLEVETKNAKILELQEKIDVLRIQSEESCNQVQNTMDLRLETLQNELTTKHRQISQFHSEKQKLTSEISQHQLRISELEFELSIAQQDSERKANSIALEKFKDVHSKHSVEVAELQSLNTSLKTELEDAKTRLVQFETKNSIVQNELATVTQSFESHKTELMAMLKDMEAQRSKEKEDYRLTLSTLKTEKLHLQQQVEEYLLKIQSLDEEKTTTIQQIQDRQAKWRAERSALLQEVASLRSNVDSLQETIDMSSTSKESANYEVVQLRNAKTTLLETIRKKENEVRDLTSSYESIIQNLHDEKKSLQGQLHTLQQRPNTSASVSTKTDIMTEEMLKKIFSTFYGNAKTVVTDPLALKAIASAIRETFQDLLAEDEDEDEDEETEISENKSIRLSQDQNALDMDSKSVSYHNHEHNNLNNDIAMDTVKEAEAVRKAEEEAEAVRRAEEEAEAVRKAEEEAEAVRKAEEEAEAVRKAEEEAEAVRRAEEEAEAVRKAEEEAEAVRRAEEEAEAARKAEEEAEAARKAEEEAESVRKKKDKKTSHKKDNVTKRSKKDKTNLVKESEILEHDSNTEISIKVTEPSIKKQISPSASSVSSPKGISLFDEEDEEDNNSTSIFNTKSVSKPAIKNLFDDDDDDDDDIFNTMKSKSSAPKQSPSKPQPRGSSVSLFGDDDDGGDDLFGLF